MESRREAVAAPGRPAPPRVILLWVVVLILVGLGVYAAAPWVLPARIGEGPMVQMTRPDGVQLVWYMSRPTACTVVVTVDGEARTLAASADGRRNTVGIDGLAPARSYPYEIRVGRRVLTSDLAFQTARADDKAHTFIVFGDSGRGTRAQYELAAEMARSQPPPDFLLHTGDLVYSDGARRKFDSRFFTPYRELIARVNFWPCLGNHELATDGGSARPYQEVFELPDNGPAGLPPDFNYWFDYGSSRVAVVDTNADEAVLRERVVPWLLEVMADPAPRWRFVSFHHPPYTGGKYEPDERVQRTLVPALEQAGIDVAFVGHDHSFQRIGPLRAGRLVEPGAGVTYIVSAAGGASLYKPRGVRPEYVAVHDFEHYSFTQVTIDGDTLSLRQIALGGDVIDDYRLEKAASGGLDAGSLTTAPASPQAVEEGVREE